MARSNDPYLSTPSSMPTNGTAVASDGHVHSKVNAWKQPGPSAYDFRSDTITTPTSSMLDAITHTTLMDDVFLEDPTTQSLESRIAQLTSHEAGLLVMSGTMGNQVSLRSHLTHPPHSILCDARSHIYNYEAGGCSTLSGAMLIPVKPSNNHHLTLEDIQENIVISDDIHACPTRIISLENTLNGMIMPLSEVKRISAFARENGIKLHLDGARIWEVIAAHNSPASSAGSPVTLSDYTSLYDSISLCFSKGLGAPIGSVIVGSRPFITQARRIRKMLGGGTRQSGIIAAAAMTAVNETFGTDDKGTNGKLADTHVRAKKLAEAWQARGGKLTWPVETNMVWLDLDAAGCSADEFTELGEQEGVKVRGGRLVVHYQIADEALDRLEKVLDEVWARCLRKKGTANGAV